MARDTPELKEALKSVVNIPITPFNADGYVDLRGVRANTQFYFDNNHLTDAEVVLCLGGTSQLQSLSLQERMDIADVTMDAMNGRGVFVAGVEPSRPTEAVQHIKHLEAMDVAPDCYLLMPDTSIRNPTGLADKFKFIADKTGVRFLVYVTDQTALEALPEMLIERPDNIIGYKYAMPEDGKAHTIFCTEVETLFNAQGDKVVDAAVRLYGRGDYWSVNNARMPYATQGHTSGLTIVFPKLTAGIFNAYSMGDFKTAQELEDLLVPIEKIRLNEGRHWNVAAVRYLARKFSHIAVGAEGFRGSSDRLPDEHIAVLDKASEQLAEYH